jgi:hypothetical protein
LSKLTPDPRGCPIARPLRQSQVGICFYTVLTGSKVCTPRSGRDSENPLIHSTRGIDLFARCLCISTAERETPCYPLLQASTDHDQQEQLVSEPTRRGPTNSPKKGFTYRLFCLSALSPCHSLHSDAYKSCPYLCPDSRGCLLSWDTL